MKVTVTKRDEIENISNKGMKQPGFLWKLKRRLGFEAIRRMKRAISHGWSCFWKYED